jgi:hypothetical protein
MYILVTKYNGHEQVYTLTCHGKVAKWAIYEDINKWHGITGFDGPYQVAIENDVNKFNEFISIFEVTDYEFRKLTDEQIEELTFLKLKI